MEKISIQPIEIVKSIRENLQALRKDCEKDYVNLTDEEREQLSAEFEELKELAMSIKKDIQTDSDK